MVSLQQLKKLALLALLVVTNQANAEMRETNSMEEALSLAGSTTLVVLDLDNTVMETNQMLGSDPFFGLLVSAANAQGILGEEAIHWALVRNGMVQPESGVRPVEEKTPGLIRGLQERNVRIMGLTSRPGAWAEKTIRQVESLGISLAITAPLLESTSLPSGLIREGIFFLRPGKSKGPALVELLGALPEAPGAIVFVDDKLSHTTSVEASLHSLPIPHTSFRYGAADQRVREFSPEIARCQWNLYLKTRSFLSDTDAIDAIRQKSCDPNHLEEPSGTSNLLSSALGSAA